ncbi:aldehyde dehydrogenase domain-containing protein [Penicillium cf. viridicatum]|uniref:aldehyde dehydrogenase (NAD(+)) n=1 Tax=Penicillium cf. viridicatum TaxID=2972119 RepID=A0A9W9JC18_9EURO|nr:aldehyde dehydrogenase domain-containing protein [Penicillium cf. viridicatum]
MSNINFSTFHNVIAGTLRSSNRLGHGINPSTRKPLWPVPLSSSEDLEIAVTAASTAFTSWSSTPWAQRQASLKQARDILHTHRAEMAEIISFEGGKPPLFAQLEVAHAMDFLDFYASQPSFEPEIIQDTPDLRLTLTHEPLGTVGAIIPWNFPLVLAIGKLAPALLAGNCVIAKPSPFTPYSLLKFAELVLPVFPASVLQTLHGDDALGPNMCEHPGITKISFTGSTATGKKIMAAASKTLKDVTLELGGNSASVVCADVDVGVVAREVALGSFFNSGQLCVASKRVYVHQDIYEEFLCTMVDIVKGWKVGAPREDGVILGPLQNEMQYNVVRVCTWGEQPVVGDTNGEGGFFLHPAIVDNPPDDSLVVRGRLLVCHTLTLLLVLPSIMDKLMTSLGPIVPVLSWSNEDELLARVNDTSTGLGGAVWSANEDRAQRIAARIEAGTIWINSFEKPLPQAYLAGHKESGFGGEWGRKGLMAYCKPKMVHYYKCTVSGSRL